MSASTSSKPESWRFIGELLGNRSFGGDIIDAGCGLLNGRSLDAGGEDDFAAPFGERRARRRSLETLQLLQVIVDAAQKNRAVETLGKFSSDSSRAGREHDGSP